jgi:ankyrin repeat protein
MKKIRAKFYDNENDVYWKLKVKTVTDESTPGNATHREFYESFLYEKVIEKDIWTNNLFNKMVQDEIFLERHIDTEDCNGDTALFFSTSYNTYKEILKLLLHYGADINHQNNYDNTALIYSINYNIMESFKLLLDAGPDVNLQNRYGDTALILAVRNNISETYIKMLLDIGADVNVRNRTGLSALSYAIRSYTPHLVQILLDAGADIFVESKDEDTILSLTVRPKICEILEDHFRKLKMKN